MAAISIECHIGMASKTVPVPNAFADYPYFIERQFFAGSRQSIELKPKNRCREPPLVGPHNGTVDALDLHLCAEKLIGNQAGMGRVNKVALVLADRYGPRDRVFGIMFDRGYATDDDPNSTALFTATPREGCAIFLGAIKSLRPAAAAFDREVEFTTIHELGHLFNLEHHESDENFMATSVAEAPFSDSYFDFLETQRNWLAQCDTNPSVYPGGSPFGFAFLANSNNGPITPANAKLKLRIGLANLTFPSSQPVELDVELRCSARNGRAFVPDRLDPGYDQFRVWVTRPTGERVRFRSPRQYCAPPSRVMVRGNRPLRRDVSLFEGAGGTTFSAPGSYRVEVEFDLGRRGILRSNTLELEVVPDSMVISKARSLVLASTNVRRFLYYRSTKCGDGVVRKIERHLVKHPDGIGANDLRYALIRGLAGAAMQEGRRQRSKILRLIADTRRYEGRLGARQKHHIARLGKLLNDSAE